MSCIDPAAYSAECAAFRDGTVFEPIYVGPSAVLQSEYPLLDARWMFQHQLVHEPDMARYLLRSYASRDRSMRRRKPQSETGAITTPPTPDICAVAP